MNAICKLMVIAAGMMTLALPDTAAAYYSPALGRFVQRDPLEYFEVQNLYQYLLSAPISARDSSGLASEQPSFDLLRELWEMWYDEEAGTHAKELIEDAIRELSDELGHKPPDFNDPPAPNRVRPRGPGSGGGGGGRKGGGVGGGAAGVFIAVVLGSGQRADAAERWPQERTDDCIDCWCTYQRYDVKRVAAAGIGAGWWYDPPEPELTPYGDPETRYAGKMSSAECAARSYTRRFLEYDSYLNNWGGRVNIVREGVKKVSCAPGPARGAGEP